MNYEEALEWLAGKRSMCNSFGCTDEAHAQLAQADAAMTQQAYWMVKAYKENLCKPKG